MKRIPFYLLLAIIILYIAFPFYWAVRSAFTPDSALFKTPVVLAERSDVGNFSAVLSSSDFQRALINSTIVAGSITIISLRSGRSPATPSGAFASGAARRSLYLMLSMTIFPQIAILGALYTMINRFHLYNTLYALIFSYMVFTLPFTVWVLTTFFEALPRISKRPPMWTARPRSRSSTR